MMGLIVTILFIIESPLKIFACGFYFARCSPAFAAGYHHPRRRPSRRAHLLRARQSKTAEASAKASVAEVAAAAAASGCGGRDGRRRRRDPPRPLAAAGAAGGSGGETRRGL
jgi:hypothetical protein